jgi:hypothetical protein
MSETCPKLVSEEFDQSQLDNSDENENEDNGAAIAAEEEELLVQPEEGHEPVQQDDWQELLGQVHEEPHVEDGEGDYGNAPLLNMYDSYDWQEDSRSLSLTEDSKKLLCGWLAEKKASENPDDDDMSLAGLPEDLNEKQHLAYRIVCGHIDSVIEDRVNGITSTPQLLLNISGAAGTGKSFWLNTIRRYALSKPQLSKDFIKSAAPSGTAAFLIGGATLHGLLLLPRTGQFQPLSEVKKAQLQQKLKHVGLLVIDEKSMIGQKNFFYISKRLQEAKPGHADQPFGGMSIVLLGDWKQLPPVLDMPLYQDPSALTGKTVAARAKELQKKSESQLHQYKTQGYQLYMKFDKAVIFEKIQRQDGDDQAQFREELHRLGEGKFTLADWKRWQCRNLGLMSPSDQESFHQEGTLACAMKKDMVVHNERKVQELQEPIAVIKATTIPPSEASRSSSDSDSGLPGSIMLCQD